MEDDEEDKGKIIHAIGYTESALPQTFCIKRNIGLDVLPDVV